AGRGSRCQDPLPAGHGADRAVAPPARRWPAAGLWPGPQVLLLLPDLLQLLPILLVQEAFGRDDVLGDPMEGEAVRPGADDQDVGGAFHHLPGRANRMFDDGNVGPRPRLVVIPLMMDASSEACPSWSSTDPIPASKSPDSSMTRMAASTPSRLVPPTSFSAERPDVNASANVLR